MLCTAAVTDSTASSVIKYIQLMTMIPTAANSGNVESRIYQDLQVKTVSHLVFTVPLLAV